MNIFGAFTFGSLIKTFIPGLMLLGAFLLLEANLVQLFGLEKTLVTRFAASNPQSFLVLSIPIGILLGLMSNTLVFMGLNDLLVRDPARRDFPKLFEIKNMVDDGIKEIAWKNLSEYLEEGGVKYEKNKEMMFKDIIDPEIIIMNKIGFEKLTFTREQYWFHLEFQLNMLISVFFLSVNCIVFIISRDLLQPDQPSFLISIVLVTFILMALLYSAARKNYNRHIEKMISLMSGALEDMRRTDPNA